VKFPIGPLELGDRNGYDTFLLVLESLTDTLGERFRPYSPPAAPNDCPGSAAMRVRSN